MSGGGCAWFDLVGVTGPGLRENEAIRLTYSSETMSG
jgi:hypothetical protein